MSLNKSYNQARRENTDGTGKVVMKKEKAAFPLAFSDPGQSISLTQFLNSKAEVLSRESPKSFQ